MKKIEECPQEVPTLAVEFTADDAVFTAGGFVCRVPRSTLVLLSDAGKVQAAFERAERPDANFADIDNVENAVRLRRLLSQGLDPWRCSRAMVLPEAKLRQFLSAIQLKYPPYDQLTQAEFNRQEAASKIYCKQRPLPASRVTQFSMPGDTIPRNGPGLLLQLESIHQRMKVESLGKIADALELDREDFNLWLEQNAGLLSLYDRAKD